MGDRVSLDDGSTGTLRFLGPVEFRHGVLAGVELDKPTGKHDGSVNGRTYFKTAPKCAVFVHPSMLSHGSGGGRRRASVPSAGHAEWTTIDRKPVIKTEHPHTPEVRLPAQESILPKVRPTITSAVKHVSTPPAMSKLDAEALREATASAMSFADDVDRSSLAAVQAELTKRQLELQNAKTTLQALRMQIADNQDVSEYRLNREKLLAALDNYERCIGRYDRQAKRVQHLQRLDGGKGTDPRDIASLKESIRLLEQDKESMIKERVELANKLEDSYKRLGIAEQSIHTLEGRVLEKTEAEVQLQQQIRENAAVAAQLNKDRSNLRKEITDLREKFNEVVNGTKNEESQQKNTQIDQLTEELNDLTNKLEFVVEENEKLRKMNESILKDEAEDLTKLNDETVEVMKHYEQMLRVRDEEIKTLKIEHPDIAKLEEEVRVLTREKEIANNQLSTLQGKFIDYQDPAQMEAKYRSQIDTLRKSLDESQRWIKPEGSGVSTTISSESAVASILSSTLAGSDTKSALETLAHQLASEQLKYAELYSAKQTQERFLTQQIAKYKRRLSSQMKTVVDQSGLGTMPSSDREEEISEGRSDTRINELEGQIEKLQREKTDVIKQKDTELYSLQLRLNMAQDERDKFHARLDEISEKSEVDILKKEVDSLAKERDILRKEVDRDAEKSRIMAIDFTRVNERLSAMTEQLNLRTEEATRLESTLREHVKTIKNQEMMILNLQREYDGKQRLADTQTELQEKEIIELRNLLEVQKKEIRPIDQAIKERNSFAEALVQAKNELERLKDSEGAMSQIDLLRRKVSELEGQLVERNARVRLLEMEKEKSKSSVELLGDFAANGSGEEDFKEYLKETENRLAGKEKRVRELELQLADHQERLSAKERTIETLYKQKETLTHIMETTVNEDGTTMLSKRDISKLDSLYNEIRDLQVRNTRLVEESNDLTVEKKNLEVRLANLEQLKESDVLLQSRLSEEARERKKLESQCQRQADMLEIAEKECSSLQERISELSTIEEQRQRITVKYSAIQEDLRMSQDRLTVKDREIQELQTRLDSVKSEVPIAKATAPVNETEAMKRLKMEKDQALAEKAHLQRMNASLEHEKALLEAELKTIREALKTLKTEIGLKQQHELLSKAGSLIEELGQTHESSWNILNPIKSIASFMRLYKPADVDVVKLQKEYEQLMATLEGNGAARQVPSISFSDVKDEMCGVCRRPGHTAIECDNRSDSHDPAPTLSLMTLDAGDPRAFSA